MCKFQPRRMKRISIDEYAHEILCDAKGRLSERGVEGGDFSDAVRELNNGMVIESWDFSAEYACESCGKEPDDCWQVAKINGKWICMTCLGKIVTGAI